MLIEVLPPKRWTLETIGAKFALQQNDFNDYWFYTNYQLYYRPDDSSSDAILIGPVKILRAGQAANQDFQITEAFDQLQDDFCSLGATLDYYQRLSELPRYDRDLILGALRDIVVDDSRAARFSYEEGWRLSLFRNNPNPDDYLADASAIYSNNYTAIAEIADPMTFTAAGWGVVIGPAILPESGH